MTTIATEGILSYGLQASKGVEAVTYYEHMAMGIDYGAVERETTVPQEVGGSAVPTGAYKSGVFMGGGATINPRLEGNFGYLLKGLMGTCTDKDAQTVDGNALPAHAADGSTVSAALGTPPAARKTILRVTSTTAQSIATKNVVITGTGGGPETIDIGAAAYVAGETKYFYGSTAFSAYTSFALPTFTGVTVAAMWVGEATTKDHFFTLSTAAAQPWMSVRKYVPGNTPFGVMGLDNKVSGLSLTLPNTGIVNARVDFLGRVPTFTPSPSWSYGNTIESTDSIPVTCKTNGFVKMPSFSANPLKVLGAQVTFGNQLTTPDTEQIIGSPYPDDIMRVLSAMSVQATMKWEDPDLYETIVTGTTSGSVWGPGVYYSDLDIVVESPTLIVASTGVLYQRLRIKANRVAWQVTNTPTLAGGQSVMMNVTGAVMKPTWGDYAQFILTNAVASY